MTGTKQIKFQKNAKRAAAFALVGVISIFCLTGCGQTKKPQESKTTTSQSRQAVTESGKQTGNKATDNQPTAKTKKPGNKKTDKKKPVSQDATESQSTENRTDETQSTENRTDENQSTENKTADGNQTNGNADEPTTKKKP